MNKEWKKMFKKPVLEYESLGTTPEKKLVSSAKNFIPDWYKKITGYDIKSPAKKSVKACVPFLDAFNSGYIITLAYDVYVRIDENGVPDLEWPINVRNPMSVRGEIADSKLVPAGHYPKEFTWQTNVAWAVPKGYSTLFTHPLNRHDLPFTTLSAILDGGLVMTPTSNVPFYVKTGFEGLIPKGTPMAQLIPFRQENWKSENKPGLAEVGLIHNDLSLTVFKGWYRKTFWVNKQYD
jgi:hypothetical protein